MSNGPMAGWEVGFLARLEECCGRGMNIEKLLYIQHGNWRAIIVIEHGI